MIIRRAHERGHADHGWLKTWHTFSFADYYDERWMGFRSLRVINEDFIAPGKGFDLHGHRDMEILTYVMSGSLRHVDSMGNSGILKAGEFQLMSAGTGVRHMEMNASQTEECHLYQIWIQPDRPGHTPSYEQKAAPELPSYATPSSSSATPAKAGAHPVSPRRTPGSSTASNKVLVASPDGRDGSLLIHQDAEIWLYRLEAGDSVVIPSEAEGSIPGKAAWVQVVSGEVEIGGEQMKTSDASGLTKLAEIKAFTESEILVFLL